MKIIVVGGGFGGIKTAIELSRRQAGEVTLISDRDFFFNHSTIYSTAAGRNERESAVPIASILKHWPDVVFIKDSIIKIDGVKKTIASASETYDYDILVLSLGMTEHISGVNGQKKYSYGTSSLDAVKSFRGAFHDMVIDADDKKLHCAIIGGGMAGVEMAGALSEYVDKIKLAHSLPNNQIQLSLVESSDRLLPAVSHTASQKVTDRLKRQKVEVITNQHVERVSKDSLVLNGKKVDTDMTVWTCGGKSHSLYANHPNIFKLSKRGKVVVNQCMLAYPSIYVIGDSAETKLSGTATTAVNDGVFVAKNIARLINGKSPYIRPTLIRPPLSIPISRFWAYVEFGGVYIDGVTGSLVRRLIELNYYCHFMPLFDAYKMWRKYRKSSEFCALCKKAD